MFVSMYIYVYLYMYICILSREDPENSPNVGLTVNAFTTGKTRFHHQQIKMLRPGLKVSKIEQLPLSWWNPMILRHVSHRITKTVG